MKRIRPIPSRSFRIAKFLSGWYAYSDGFGINDPLGRELKQVKNKVLTSISFVLPDVSIEFEDDQYNPYQTREDVATTVEKL
jgi:hypothetical protein